MARLRRLARRLLRLRGSRAGRVPAEVPPDPPQPDTVGGVTLANLEALELALIPDDRPLLVNHWATWCEGCVVELPLLVELHGRWNGQVNFLGVSWDRFMPDGTPFQALRRVDELCISQGVGWPNLVFTGEPDELFERLSLPTRTIPQTSLLLLGGTVAWSHALPLEPEDVHALETVLRARLEPPGRPR